MSTITKDPANSQTFTDGNKILTGSGGAVEVGELENVNSSLQTGRFTRRVLIDFHICVHVCVHAQKMLNRIHVNTHLSNKDEMHKEADPADDKSKDLPPHRSAKPPWEHINGRGDKALHCHKLRQKYNNNNNFGT